MGYNIPADHHGGLPSREIERVPTPNSAQQNVIAALRASQTALEGAYQCGLTASPLVQNIPAFQRIQAMSKEIASLMLEVSKLRGL